MKSKIYSKASIGFASLFAAAALSFSPAMPAQAPAQPAGQPARAVRLSYVDGKVQLYQGGQILADPAVLNAPLFEGTQIVTGDDGKAEVQFEDGSVARVSPASALTLGTLSTGATNLVVDRGLAYFELQPGGQIGPITIAFADSAVTASGFTILRVNMDNPPGELAVLSGNAHVDRGVTGQGMTGSLDLHGGESVAFNAADAANPIISGAIPPDSWDAWNSDRDQALNAEASTQTQAPSAIAGAGASNPAWTDLDASGNWYNVPGQGYVWSPYDAANAGFDPYGNGSWIASPGYGYIWASAYPWGYLPYQCGLWNFYDGFGWGWAPGLGGCNPWWNIGVYIGPRFGVLPIGYQPIRPPIFPRGGVPVRGRVIPVNRNSFRAANPLPARTATTPVTIAGRTVQPLHAIAPRTAYMGSASTGGRTYSTGASQPGSAPGRSGGFAVNPPSALSPGSAAPTYTRPPQQRTVTPTQPQRFSGSGSQPTNSAPRTYSPPPRPSAPPPSFPSHPSGGGGASSHAPSHK